MCGIVGIHSLSGDRPIESDVLASMNAAIRHRGPDDEGFYEDPSRVGLAMRRLSIIDLGGGHQPMCNEDESVWVVFNGEIYNFRELRAELEPRGHRFVTNSDTEVLVHAYEEYGDVFVERLRGMFSIALWDRPRRRLVLVRDRVGIKQLYYTIVDGQLLFGSEIKCLLRHPGVERHLAPDALDHFLTYLYVPAPWTIYDGISQLEPAQMLVVENGSIKRRTYWDLHYAPDRGRSEERTAEELRERLEDAVRVRLVSDVPLGAFLSGGIDSGSVVALMAPHTDGPVETFAVGYEEGGEAFDERPQARQVAERYGTRHHEFVVRTDLIDVMPRLLRAFDQPFADSSAIPNWYLSELTRRHVTVALSGLGGDELMAGYERYRGALLAERLAWLPRGLRRGVIAPLVERLPDSRRGGHWAGRAKRFVRALDLSFDERYLDLISAFDAARRAEIVSPEVRARFSPEGPREHYLRTLAPVRDADPLHRALYADLKLYLPDDLLPLTDRMSMAHSLEVRVPYLDHLLLEFAATIPPELKLRGMERKYILKRAVRDLLPRELLERKKMGFSVPLTVWFRRELREFVEDQLDERGIREAGVFHYPAVRRVLDDHFAARANYDNHIWALLAFSTWHRDYIAGRAGLEDAAGPLP